MHKGVGDCVLGICHAFMFLNNVFVYLNMRPRYNNSC